MHPLHDYVAKQLADKLKSRRIVDPIFFGDPKTAAMKVLGG